MPAEPTGLRLVHPLLRARDWQDRPQLDEVCRWWRETGGTGGSGVCALVGIGGAGKTAVADRFLQLLPGGIPLMPGVARRADLPPPRRLLVFSFYEAPNPDDLFAEVAAWLGAGGAEAHAGDGAPRASFQQVLRLLAGGGPCLLVLDGLEKAQDDGARGGVFGQLLDRRLSDLVRRLAGGWLPGVAALLTSRFPLAELDQAWYEGQAPLYRAIPVEEIDEAAGVRLLRGRGVRGGDGELAGIVRECGAHALTVDLTGGWIAEFAGGDPGAAPDLASRPEEVVEVLREEPDPRKRAVLEQERRFGRIAGRYRNSLAGSDPAALALLERVCLFRLGVTAEILAAVFTGPGKDGISGPELATLNRRALERKLRKLADLRLLETQPGATYAIHPAVREGFLLGLDQATARCGHEAAKEGLLAALGGLPDEESYPSDSATLDLLEEIVHHTLEAGRVEEAWEVYEARVGNFENLGWRLGAYERGERICRDFAGGLTPERALARHSLPGAAHSLRDEASAESVRPSRPSGPREDKAARQVRPLRDQSPSSSGKACPFEGLPENKQASFFNEWGLYLDYLGRSDAAARCYERNNEVQLRQGRWNNASIGKTNLADATLSAGRLSAARRAAEEALRLAVKTEDDMQRACSIAYRAHTHALRGEIAAWGDFAAALRWQRKAEGKPDRPLWSLRGIQHARFLARLGQDEEARRQTQANLEILQPWGPDDPDKVQCRLLLADLARERGDLAEARRLQEQAHEWAMSRDAREVLCWSASVRGRIHIAEGEGQEEGEARETAFVAAAESLEEGLAIARDCGYGIYHVDLVLDRARLPPPSSGLPTLLAATDPECGYAWGIARGRHLRGQALLLEAARLLGRPDFAPAREGALPEEARALIASARHELEECRELRRKIEDPKVAEAERALADLAGGGLAEPRLWDAMRGAAAAEPPPPATDRSTGRSWPMPTDARARVFVSHASRDKPFVRRLVSALQERRLKVWFDEREIRVGESIVERVSEGLRDTDYLVVVLSRASVASPWVREELNAALMRQISEEGAVVLPVLIEDCEIPPLLKSRLYADFRTDFEAGLEKLLAVFAHEGESALEVPPELPGVRDHGRGQGNGSLAPLPPPPCTAALGALTLADLRRRMTKRMSRSEVGTVWFDTFSGSMDNDMGKRPLVECVIELLDRAKNRNQLPSVLDSLCHDRPDLATL